VAAAQAVGVDETSFQRRHEYVTVVNDLTTSEPRVLYVADGRSRAALDGYWQVVGRSTRLVKPATIHPCDRSPVALTMP